MRAPRLKVATTQLSLEPVADPGVFWRRVETLVEQASRADAAIILLPEYGGLSLMLRETVGVNFTERLVAYSGNGAREYEQRMMALAQRHKIAIVAGTVPWTGDDGRLVNRCIVALADGTQVVQDKIHMTRFEDETWHVVAAADPALRLFSLAGVRCAVLICYDVEFPSVSSAAARAGVEVLFVPSCTDDMHGYWRVRHCAHARTVENQCYAVLSSVVAGDRRFDEISEHYGQGAVLSPCDVGFPLRGILCEGLLNTEGVIWADLDLELLDRTRRDGTVLNLRDQGTVPPIL